MPSKDVGCCREPPRQPANRFASGAIPMHGTRHIIIPFSQIPAPIGQSGCLVRTPMAKNIARITGLILALAPAVAAAVFIVSFPWARPAAKGAATEVFMEVTSIEGAALVGARSNIAGSALLVGPGANVKPAERLMLPSGAPVILAPGSYRVRLSPLDRTLKLGDTVPLVLIIEALDGSRQEIPMTAEVRRRSTVDDHLQAHHH